MLSLNFLAPKFMSGRTLHQLGGAALVLCLGVPNAVSFGQDGPQQGVQVLGISISGDSENAPELGEIIGSSISIGGPNISFGGPGLGGVNPNSRSQLFQLLSNESVRNELKLTDDQYAGVKGVMKESQKRTQEMIQGAMAKQKQQGSSRSFSFGGEDFRNLMAENEALAEAAIEEILLPGQMERIKQLAYQIDVEQVGVGISLTEGRLGEDIGVHEGQKQDLLDAAKKIDAETKAAILRIKAEARKKLFKELTPDQRKQAEELLGDYFQYETLTIQQRIRQSVRKARDQKETEEVKKKKARR